MTRGVETANDAAYAGSGDGIDRNVMLLKILQNSEVGQAEAAAAGECQRHAGAMRRRGLRSQRRREKKHDEERGAKDPHGELPGNTDPATSITRSAGKRALDCASSRWTTTA